MSTKRLRRKRPLIIGGDVCGWTWVDHGQATVYYRSKRPGREPLDWLGHVKKQRQMSRAQRRRFAQIKEDPDREYITRPGPH